MTMTDEEIAKLKDDSAKAAKEATDAKAALEEMRKAGDPAGLAKKNKELLDELKKSQASGKSTAEKAAEADRLRAELEETRRLATEAGVNLDAKDAEAARKKREADAAAKAESDRVRFEGDTKREKAILRALVGLVPAGAENLTDYALWKLSSDPSIVVNPESGAIEGLNEAREKLKADPVFAGAAQGNQKPGTMPPPRAPRQGQAGDVDPKFRDVTSFRQLVDMGESNRKEYEAKYAERYAFLYAQHQRSLAFPRFQPAGPVAAAGSGTK